MIMKKKIIQSVLVIFLIGGLVLGVMSPPSWGQEVGKKPMSAEALVGQLAQYFTEVGEEAALAELRNPAGRFGYALAPSGASVAVYDLDGKLVACPTMPQAVGRSLTDPQKPDEVFPPRTLIVMLTGDALQVLVAQGYAKMLQSKMKTDPEGVDTFDTSSKSGKNVHEEFRFKRVGKLVVCVSVVSPVVN